MCVPVGRRGVGVAKERRGQAREGDLVGSALHEGCPPKPDPQQQLWGPTSASPMPHPALTLSCAATISEEEIYQENCRLEFRDFLGGYLWVEVSGGMRLLGR